MTTSEQLSDSTISQERQRRRYFRIVYPIAIRPKVTSLFKTYDVLDISEEGIRLDTKGHPSPRLDQIMKGTLCFYDGEKLPIQGTILRVTAEDAVLQLNEPIPYRTIHNQELFMIRHYRKDE